MRLLIVNPNTTVMMTEHISEYARQYARSDTEIVGVNPQKGPVSIEGFFDEAIASEAILDLLIQNRENYDAYIIACFGDPGLFAAREIMKAPVIGIAEAAMLTACMVGYRFSVLDIMERTRPQIEDLLGRYGFGHRCASIRAVGAKVLETTQDPEIIKEKLIKEGKKAVEEDGAEVLLLGCAGMAGLDKSIERALNVPVLDGVVCAVKIAEGLVDYGISTSKVRAFKYPEPKEFKNCSPAISFTAER
ncbi:MAG: aspartate/glutamate racemase family protein [Deltaproteobacteria bacterium]|nr:aspartate/glutamate racemase family protein [Deltaproteobacteria bacterium]MBW1961559.1 aspartate/glutamate racemase family protein [Deltaproteobacteria bacterium]MBW2152348.1 aspartate/glutamate racemase family protein [Deltaproteobacteria bacterium]